MYVVTAQEMRAFDSAAINEYGIPGVVLMENAGRTSFHILNAHLGGDVRDLKAVIVAGPGNNGGDGYVIGRYLLNHGADVLTFLLSPRDRIKGDALINLLILEKMTDRIFDASSLDGFGPLVESLENCDVIVDAILGTGLSSAVRSPFKEAVEEINRSPALRFAVDIPSGIDSDTGKVLGNAVEADLTATYGFRKLGTVLWPGMGYCGKVEVVDISIPLPAIERNPPRAIFYTNPQARQFSSLRMNPEAHKGTFGHVLIVGGSPGKTGAPIMSAKSATRVGAGLVTVGVPASLNPILEVKLTEEMTEPLPEMRPGFLGTSALERITALTEGKRCLVLGPGLSTEGDIPEMVGGILSSYSGWIVLDADGLNAVSANPDQLKYSKANIVITPHPGEMGRLTGLTTSQVQEDRPGLARRFAAEYGVWVVLKGAGTITAAPDGFITVNSTGSPWMASGGQGDVLSGILGGLLAQNIPAEEALPLGVYLHGLAADKLVERSGPSPVPACDVIDELKQVLGCLLKEDIED